MFHRKGVHPLPGYEPEPFGICIGPYMFHRNGFSWLPIVARRPRKWSFMTRDRRTQAKKNIPQPYPRRGGNRAPDQKKTIEKSVFLHPGRARGDSSPGPKKNSENLAFAHIIRFCKRILQAKPLQNYVFKYKAR